MVDATAGLRLRPWTTDTRDVAALAAAWADPSIAAANGVPQDASASAAARWLAGDPARVAAGRCLDLVVSPLAGDRRRAEHDPAAVPPDRGAVPGDRSTGSDDPVALRTDRGAVPTDRSMEPDDATPVPDTALVPDRALVPGSASVPDPALVLGEVGLRNIDRVRRRAEISWWTAPGHRGRGLATAATRLLTDWALDPAGGRLVQVWARIDPANVASARVAASAGLDHLGTAGGTDVWARTG